MHEQSITLLNRAVADELSAVHQYMYFHFHCDDQGYEERHYDQYDQELDNMAKFGDRYLALQSIERSKNRGAGRPVA